MKSSHLVGELLDGSFIFFIAYNDDPKDTYCGYFSQSKQRDASINELKPLALADIKDGVHYLSDEIKAYIHAKKLYILGGEKACNDTINGCQYDIKISGNACYAYFLALQCQRVIKQNKGK